MAYVATYLYFIILYLQSTNKHDREKEVKHSGHLNKKAQITSLEASVYETRLLETEGLK